MNERSAHSSEVLEDVSHTEDWTDDDGEVRELTAEDFKRMKPFSDLPLELQQTLLAVKTATFRPDEDPIQVPVSKSVVEGFRNRGDDWQDRVDCILREWLEQHKAS